MSEQYHWSRSARYSHTPEDEPTSALCQRSSDASQAISRFFREVMSERVTTKRSPSSGHGASDPMIQILPSSLSSSRPCCASPLADAERRAAANCARQAGVKRLERCPAPFNNACAFAFAALTAVLTSMTSAADGTAPSRSAIFAPCNSSSFRRLPSACGNSSARFAWTFPAKR